ncbi:MAG: biotin-dependent carboxyltransferase family protein [Hydrogenophaga sp.]
MSGCLEIVQPGIGTTVQDAGRTGHRHHGLPVAGWLDVPLAQAANALLGNPIHAALLELRGLGTRWQVIRGPVRIAMTGRVEAIVWRPDGLREVLPAWQTTTLHTGDAVQTGLAEDGCAYLAVSGGLDLPPAFGSRSTDWRAGLQGVLGRAFVPGDRLPCGGWGDTDAREWRYPVPWTLDDGPIRVLPGPQDGHFTPDAWASFFDQSWQATTAQNRMGVRLQGSPLTHTSTAMAEIVSDGAAPGAIQVPANGQPIVLLADSQTVGGYPKMATVITADQPRLAHLRPGTRIRFVAVNLDQAHAALRAQRARWQRWLGTRQTFLPPGTLDQEALYSANLVSGVLGIHPPETLPCP